MCPNTLMLHLCDWNTSSNFFPLLSCKFEVCQYTMSTFIENKIQYELEYDCQQNRLRLFNKIGFKYLHIANI